MIAISSSCDNAVSKEFSRKTAMNAYVCIQNVISDLSYKLNECVTNKPTYKCSIYATRPDNVSVCVTMYKHQTLAQLRDTLTNKIQSENSTIELGQIHTKFNRDVIDQSDQSEHKYSDYIPAPSTSAIATRENNYYGSLQDIHDIFIYNPTKNRIISIPYDNNTTLFEFIMKYSSDLETTYSLKLNTWAYKIYIIDQAYLQKYKKRDHIV